MSKSPSNVKFLFEKKWKQKQNKLHTKTKRNETKTKLKNKTNKKEKGKQNSKNNTCWSGGLRQYDSTIEMFKTSLSPA